MDKDIRNFLETMSDCSELNFDALIKYIDDNEIPIANIGINGAPAMSTPDSIYVDVVDIARESDERIFFAFLHEIGHQLKSRKTGAEAEMAIWFLEDFNETLNLIVKEERFADRFANILFNRMNGYSIDEYQEFDDEDDIEEYGDRIRPVYEYLNCEEDFDNVFKMLTFKR